MPTFEIELIKDRLQDASPEVLRTTFLVFKSTADAEQRARDELARSPPDAIGVRVTNRLTDEVVALIPREGL